MSILKAKKLEQEILRLQHLVYYDLLTGLLNRRGFEEEGEREFHLISGRNVGIERRTGFQIPFCVLFVDLDDFKKLNDKFGHKIGDIALRQVAEILRTQLRSGDLVGRIGGEEFVVALLGVNLRRAVIIAEKIRHAIEQIIITASRNRRVTLSASFGIAEYHNQRTLHELIEQADKAMYKAKRAGKNQVQVFKIRNK